MMKWLVKFALAFMVLLCVSADVFAGPFIDRIRERRSERQHSRHGVQSCGTQSATTPQTMSYPQTSVTPAPQFYSIQNGTTASGCANGSCNVPTQSRGLFFRR